VDRVIPRGLQGRSIDYSLKHYRYDAQGLLNVDGALEIELKGTVRGRVRPDGRIDLVVGAMRTIRKDSLGTGDGGAMQATVKDGETIEFELPKLLGQLPGIDLPTLLEGQRTAIRVQARHVS
jgi:hypothetical protein